MLRTLGKRAIVRNPSWILRKLARSRGDGFGLEARFGNPKSAVRWEVVALLEPDRCEEGGS